MRRGVTAVLSGGSAAFLIGAFQSRGFASIVCIMLFGVTGAVAVVVGRPR